MKITKLKLKQIIKEELEEGLGGYFGGIAPVKNPPRGLPAKNETDSAIDALEELRNAIGNDSDLLEKMKQYVPPKILQQLIQKIAGQEKLTIGGIKYIS